MLSINLNQQKQSDEHKIYMFNMLKKSFAQTMNHDSYNQVELL